MPQEFVKASQVAHHFGGQRAPDAVDWDTSGATGRQVSPIRTPQEAQKPKALELIFLELWEAHGNGLKPKPEHTFHEIREWRFDFCWPNLLVAVECDGKTHRGKGGRHNSDGDKEKMNEAAIAGFYVLHFSRKMMEDAPEWCAETVIRMLVKAAKDLGYESN